jgi:hypothetical protein
MSAPDAKVRGLQRNSSMTAMKNTARHCPGQSHSDGKRDAADDPGIITLQPDLGILSMSLTDTRFFLRRTRKTVGRAALTASLCRVRYERRCGRCLISVALDDRTNLVLMWAADSTPQQCAKFVPERLQFTNFVINFL